jgi:hypothetical protein
LGRTQQPERFKQLTTARTISKHCICVAAGDTRTAKRAGTPRVAGAALLILQSSAFTSVSVPLVSCKLSFSNNPRTPNGSPWMVPTMLDDELETGKHCSSWVLVCHTCSLACAHPWPSGWPFTTHTTHTASTLFPRAFQHHTAGTKSASLPHLEHCEDVTSLRKGAESKASIAPRGCARAGYASLSLHPHTHRRVGAIVVVYASSPPQHLCVIPSCS